MRYTAPNKADWVEFKSGTGRYAMQEIADCLSVAHGDKLLEHVAKSHFVNRHGEPFSLDTPDDIMRLSSQQHTWLAGQLIQWSMDDTLDPEA